MRLRSSENIGFAEGSCEPMVRNGWELPGVPSGPTRCKSRMRSDWTAGCALVYRIRGEMSVKCPR